MKKTFLLAIGLLSLLMGLAPIAAADNDDSSTTGSSPSPWYLGTGLGVDIPAQDWNPDFPIGGTANLFSGCHLSPTFSLQLSVTPTFFTGNGLSVADLRVSPELRWMSFPGGVDPYFLLGPGFDFQFASPSGYSTSSFAALGGIGFQFDLRPGEHAFIESRYYFLIYKNITQEDVPILVGLSEDL